MTEGNRDKAGRYLPGHSIPGPGRPERAREEQYMEALVESVPLVRFLKMCQVHAARAEAGDLATFRTFLDRLLGKARESPATEALSEALRDLLLDAAQACDTGDGDGDGEAGETTS